MSVGSVSTLINHSSHHGQNTPIDSSTAASHIADLNSSIMHHPNSSYGKDTRWRSPRNRSGSTILNTTRASIFSTRLARRLSIEINTREITVPQRKFYIHNVSSATERTVPTPYTAELANSMDVAIRRWVVGSFSRFFLFESKTTARFKCCLLVEKKNKCFSDCNNYFLITERGPE